MWLVSGGLILFATAGLFEPVFDDVDEELPMISFRAFDAIFVLRLGMSCRCAPSSRFTAVK
jgi:hypothetical protein